jgi:hypothetical protein
MGSPPQDFKSRASTDFATPASDALSRRASIVQRRRTAYSLPRTTETGAVVRSRRVRTLWRRAGNGTRTRDPNLGKVVLYQLSYSRVLTSIFGGLGSDKRCASPYGHARSGLSRSDAKRVDRIPERVRKETRDRCVAPVRLGSARLVDLLGCKSVIEGSASQPAHDVARIGAE